MMPEEKILLKYYYFRDSYRNPRITVCLAYFDHDPFERARGVAFCSFKDSPNKKIGRAIATGRALKALIEGTRSSPMCREEINAIVDTCWFETISREAFLIDGYKSCYKPELDDFETWLIKR